VYIMLSGSLVSALERFPIGQRPILAHLLRAAVLKVPFFSFGQMLTVWSVFAADDYGGLSAIRNFSGFRGKNREKVKTVAKALCDRGLLQQEEDVRILPLEHARIGGPYHAPATPVYTWQPLPEEDSLRRDELRPFLHHTIGSIDLPVEIRKWRTGDFSNRFIFPEPTTCPRVTVYLATPETTERVEQENDGIPTRQALEDWTMKVPILDHYYGNYNRPGWGDQYQYPAHPRPYAVYTDTEVARKIHDYYTADIYVQLLQRDPEMASRYYYLDRASRCQEPNHLKLPDAAVFTNDGHLDHFKMFAGGVVCWTEELRYQGSTHYSPTSLCQIHERIEQHRYELY